MLDYTHSDMMHSVRAGLANLAKDALVGRKPHAGRHWFWLTAEEARAFLRCLGALEDGFQRLRVETNALWKKHYRANALRSAALVRRNPARGIAISAASGTTQLYAWDVLSGILRQLTHTARKE